MTYKVLDLFSGIGGFSLGLERTGGFETVAFCEIEKYPQQVLAKHWPDIPIFNDVRQIHEIPNPNERRMAERRLDKTNAEIGRGGRTNNGRSKNNNRWITGTCANGENATVGPIDVITGGFPCQDISVAGNQKGIGEGTRSGLWSECARLVGEIRPRYAIFENVTALLSGADGKWFERVLWDISQIGGYVVEWHCIPASQLGAHHHRDRVWIILRNTDSERLKEFNLTSISRKEKQPSGGYDKRKGNAPDTNDKRSVQRLITGVSGEKGSQPNDQPIEGRGEICRGKEANRILANTDSGRSEQDSSLCKLRPSGTKQQSKNPGSTDQTEKGKEREETISNSNGAGLERRLQHEISYQEGWEIQSNGRIAECDTGRERHRDGIWAIEPSICGMADGLSDGVYEGRVTTGVKDRAKRLKTLGNSVVPQIPELIGRSILEAENEKDM
jgi:DNA-cytosine methyltransferase